MESEGQVSTGDMIECEISRFVLALAADLERFGDGEGAGIFSLTTNGAFTSSAGVWFSP